MNIDGGAFTAVTSSPNACSLAFGGRSYHCSSKN
jgi:hypothetical protein